MLVPGFLGFLLFYDKKYIRKIDGISLVKILSCGIIGHAASNIFEVNALQGMGIALGSAIYSLTPICTGIFSKIFSKKDKVTLEEASYAAISSLGLLIASFDLSILSFQYSFHHVVYMFIAMTSACYLWVQLRDINQRAGENVSPIFINSSAMLVAGISGILFSIVFEGSLLKNLGVLLIKENVIKMTVLILMSNVFASLLYGLLLKRVSALYMSMVGSIHLPISCIVGYLAFGETVNNSAFFGYGLVILGSVLFARSQVIASR